MKLTKRGISPDELPRTATCQTCKSEYEFTLNDSALVYHAPYYDQRDDGHTPAYYNFKCQVCGQYIKVTK